MPNNLKGRSLPGKLTTYFYACLGIQAFSEASNIFGLAYQTAFLDSIVKAPDLPTAMVPPPPRCILFASSGVLPWEDRTWFSAKKPLPLRGEQPSCLGGTELFAYGQATPNQQTR